MSNDSSERVALIAHLAEVAHAEYKRWTKGWIGIASAVVDSYEAHKKGVAAASRLIAPTNQPDGKRFHATLLRFVPNERDVWVGWLYNGSLHGEFDRAASEFAKPYIDELESTKAELLTRTAQRDDAIRGGKHSADRVATLESELARVKAENAALRDAAKHVVSVADSMPQLRVDPYCSWIAGAIDELRKLLAGASS